jgi:hypothetical protein
VQTYKTRLIEWCQDTSWLTQRAYPESAADAKGPVGWPDMYGMLESGGLVGFWDWLKARYPQEWEDEHLHDLCVFYRVPHEAALRVYVQRQEVIDV